MLGRDYGRKILEPLIAAGLIEVAGGFLPSGRSKTYRLGREHWDAPLDLVPFDLGDLPKKARSYPARWLKKASKDVDLDLSLEDDEEEPQEKHEASRGPAQSLPTPVFGAAHRHVLESFTRIRLPSWTDDFVLVDLRKALATTRQRKFNNCLTMLQRLRHGDVTGYDDSHQQMSHAGVPATIDRWGRRLYYPLVNLPRPLRACLELDGEPIAEVDVSSSQPLCAISALYPKAPQDGALPQEQAAYSDAVFSGTFYNVLSGDLTDEERAKVNEKLARTKNLTLKNLIMQEVFNGKPYYENRPFWKAFEARFPVLAKLIRNLKAPVPPETERTSKRYKRIGSMLTREESRLIFGAVERLANERPKAPLCTIHDAIVCRQSDAEWVKAGLVAHYRTALGRAPKVKISLPREDPSYLSEDLREKLKARAARRAKQQPMGKEKRGAGNERSGPAL